MSTPSDPTDPTDPTDPNGSTGPTVPADPTRSEQPAERPAAPEAPTAASDEAPTAAYDPAPPAPPLPPAAPEQAPYAGYGQPGYAQAPYGQPPVAASGPDTRPKTLARVSLGLAIVGALLACVGFIPLGWGGLVAVLVGGLMLLVAFVLSIVVLASRKQGGKPLGIAALIVSVLGAVVWTIALVVAFVFGVLATAEQSADAAPSPSVSAPGENADDLDADDAPAGDVSEADEAAFLAEARPQLNELFAEIDPSFTDETVRQVFPDDALVGLGQSFAQAGDGNRQLLVDTLVTNLEGVLDAEAAERFIDILTDAADEHLM